MLASRLRTQVLNKAERAGGRFLRFVQVYSRAGRNVRCALCGWGGRNFPDKKCPRCGSLARHRLIPYSMSYFDLNLNQKVLLHVGPNMGESGWISKQFKLREYLRVDLKKHKLINLVADLEAIPLLSESIDHILLWHVLEHIHNDRAVIAEMHRVLRKGGGVLVSVPIFPPDRERTFEDSSVKRENYQEVYGHFDHVRACGSDYGDRFKASGFSVRELRVKNLPNDSDLEFYGLSENHIAWYCTKE
jgi:SAM-dependent methyltransferase